MPLETKPGSATCFADELTPGMRVMPARNHPIWTEPRKIISAHTFHGLVHVLSQRDDGQHFNYRLHATCLMRVYKPTQEKEQSMNPCQPERPVPMTTTTVPDPYANLDGYKYFLVYEEPNQQPLIISRDSLEREGLSLGSRYVTAYALPLRPTGEMGPDQLELLRVDVQRTGYTISKPDSSKRPNPSSEATMASVWPGDS